MKHFPPSAADEAMEENIRAKAEAEAAADAAAAAEQRAAEEAEAALRAGAEAAKVSRGKSLGGVWMLSVFGFLIP